MKLNKTIDVILIGEWVFDWESILKNMNLQKRDEVLQKNPQFTIEQIWQKYIIADSHIFSILGKAYRYCEKLYIIDKGYVLENDLISDQEEFERGLFFETKAREEMHQLFNSNTELNCYVMMMSVDKIEEGYITSVSEVKALYTPEAKKNTEIWK